MIGSFRVKATVLFALTPLAASRDTWATGDGCTSIIVGPGGTVAGGTLTTHTDDCMECDFRISKVPAADHAEGSTRKIQRYRSQYPRYLGYDRGETYFPENTDMSIYKWAPGEGDFEPIGEIPQVKHTHGYIDGGYGIMNEYQVTIGESTCGAVLTALPVHRGGHALLEAGELSRIALERCKTAKCAVSTMGALAEKHGFYGADETKGEGGEALQVVDPNEAWVFHVLADDTGKSAVWAAQRVPEGHIAAVANQFVIRTVYLNDTTNFLGSTNILDVAERAGVWDASKNGIHVDFTQAFAMDRGHLSPYATRRVWRIFDLVSPSLALPATTNSVADDYPFSVPVDTPVAVSDILAINRDHYEGTPYDMTVGLASGPYGDPSRFDPGATRRLAGPYGDEETIDDAVAWGGKFERAISIYRCSYSWVGEARPHLDNGLGVIWFGQYAPHASQYVPIYQGGSKVPASFTKGSLFKFEPQASYWVHAAIGNWADRFYIHTISDIKSKQAELEGALFMAQAGLEAAANEMLQWAPKGEGVKFLNEVSDAASVGDLDEWGQFLYILIAKFKDGQRIDGPPGGITYAEKIAPTKLFYPKWWLDAVGYFESDDELLNSSPSMEIEGSAPQQRERPSTLSGVIALLFTHGLVAAGVALAFTKPNSKRSGSIATGEGKNHPSTEEQNLFSNNGVFSSVSSFNSFGSLRRSGYTNIPTQVETVEMVPTTRQTYQQSTEVRV